MRYLQSLARLSVLLLASSLANAPRADAAPPGAPATSPATAPASDYDYQPPVEKWPADFKGTTAARCASDPSLYVVALVPPGKVALTAREQPSLFWSVNKPTGMAVKLTLVRGLNPDDATTVLTLLRPPSAAALPWRTSGLSARCSS